MRIYLLLLFFSLVSICAYPQATSEKLIRRGVSLHDKGKYNDAISYYKQALKINPSSMSAIYEMSLSYLHLKDYNNALKYSTQVINANFQPLLVDAYCVKSAALADMDRINDAIKLLNDAVLRCGSEYLLLYNLGLCYFKKKDYSNSAKHLQDAIETDATNANAFLLYAYALEDSNRWIQSFLSFHFFLLLEPNTKRSKDAFKEMYSMMTTTLASDSPRLQPEDGIDRKKIYDYIQQNNPSNTDSETEYAFFEDITKKILLNLNQLQDDSRKGLLWDFFVPVYGEILNSGYIDTYCRYVSVSHFATSLEWWSKNTEKVDNFITWFEDGQGGDNDSELEGDEYGDDSEEEL